MKSIFIIACFLAVGWLFTYTRLSYTKKELNTLEAEKKAISADVERLAGELKKRNDEIKELFQQKSQLETAAKKDFSVFDWNADISGTNVIKRLHED